MAFDFITGQKPTRKQYLTGNAAWSTSGFQAVLRKRVASLWERVRHSSNSLLKVVAGRTDSPIIAHWISVHMVKLYKSDGSPPARACMMACELFNVPTEMVTVNVFAGEHLSADFLKKNPTHTIPVLEDGDLTIHDSHAILMYLADVYGKQDSFYPKDLKQRALVNQKMFFNSSILFPRLRNIMYPLFVDGIKPIEKQFKAIDEAYGFLEEFLSRTKYVAGNNMTIADIEEYATTSSLAMMLELDVKKYPKIEAWNQEMAKQPFAQKQNAAGNQELKTLYVNQMST